MTLTRFGPALVQLLEGYGVDYVFGIPGVHTAELYRGLETSRIRHVTPRHEQGAGFMADGYARLSGKPGVCFVITGPGLTNIATAAAQAYADSIPMLIISGVNATGQLCHGNGNLHELPDQQRLAACFTAFSHTLLRPGDLPAVLARAFAVFDSARPRPVHIEIPIDRMPASIEADFSEPVRLRPASPSADTLDRAAALLRAASRPLILAGGGVRNGAASLRSIAERLGAPVVQTVNARGLLPFRHPLSVPTSPSLQAVRALVTEADVALAVGPELGPTDYNMDQAGGFEIPGRLIRIDIDTLQLTRHRTADLGLVGDAAATLAALAERLPGSGADHEGASRAGAAREAAFAELTPLMRQQVCFLEEIREALPGVAIVGDSTQAVYAGNLFYEPDAPRGWINSAVGYGTLGYALPAAIGAKLAAPDRPVVCLAGDGGLQFTLGELGSAIDAGTPVIVLVWNNRSYGEIKTFMEARGIRPEGVDLATPDFVAIARAYGFAGERLQRRDQLTALLLDAAGSNTPTLIEIDDAVVMADLLPGGEGGCGAAG